MTTAKLAPKGLSVALLAALVLAAGPALAAKPAAPAARASFPDADWRTPDPENVVVVDTSKGRVIVELTPWAAPVHVERVKTLIRRGFYDGLSFFRVIDGFMAQTGDPKNTGMGGADDLPDIAAEFTFRRGPAQRGVTVGKLPPDFDTQSPTEIAYLGPMVIRGAPEMQMMASADGKVVSWPLFCAGVLGMARSQDPNSANSQFFFMRATYPSLDKNYTAFGRVISGLPAIQAIKIGEPVSDPRDTMTRVRMLADIPAAERPTVQVLSTASPSFKALVAAAKEKGGGTFSPCDIEIPAKVG